MSARSARKYTLRGLMIAVGLATAIIPASVIGIGSGLEMREVILQQALGDTVRSSGRLASRIDQFLNTALSNLRQAADNMAGLETLDEASVRPLLANMRNNFPVYVSTFLAMDGKTQIIEPFIRADGSRAVGGTDISDRGYYKEIMQTKKALIDKAVILGRGSLRPVAIAIAPILNAQGDIRALVAASVDFSDLQTLTERFSLGRTGTIHIASADGTAIAGPDPAIFEKLTNISDMPLWPQFTAGETGQIRDFVGADGESRLAGFATVPVTGWKVWITQARSELDEEVLQSYVAAGMWALLAIVVAIIMVFLMVIVVSRPVESLRATAAAIRGGDLAQRAREDGPAELVSLAAAVNGMADALQHRINDEQAAKEEIESVVGQFGGLAARIAAGDLAARTTYAGEGDLARLGEGLNGMAESLERMVAQIGETVQSLTSSATEILAATSQQVSATTEEAAAVKQTAATVAEVRQTAELAARRTRDVAEQAQRATAIASDGIRSVEESIHGSGEAKARMVALSTRILEFSEQAQAIAEVNAAVNGLAEQSNLLAVNAGIEAAKAGEAGKGFAVVANEVKALANRSKEATAQVRQIVNEIQKSAQAAVLAAEQGVKASEAGVGTAERSGQAIGRLDENIREAAQAAQQIMASAEQQEAGMDQIAMAMQNIEQSSSQTVAATQQVERAARDLNELAQKLTSLLRASSGDTLAVRRRHG